MTMGKILILLNVLIFKIIKSQNNHPLSKNHWPVLCTKYTRKYTQGINIRKICLQAFHVRLRSVSLC